MTWNSVSVYSAESPAGGSMITLTAVALSLSAVCGLIPGQGFEKASLSPVVILASVNPVSVPSVTVSPFPVFLQIQSLLLFVKPLSDEPVFLAFIVVLDSVLLWGCILSDHCL